MELDLVGIVLIIGTVQGFALAFLIFQKGRTLFSNRFLWVLMLSFSATFILLWFSDSGFYINYPHFMLATEGIPLIIFPLYFLYTKYLVLKREDFSKNDWIHFLPFILYKLFLIPFYFMSPTEIFNFQNSSLISGMPLQYIIFNWVLIIQGIIYMILVLKRVRKRDEFINEHFSNNSRIKLDWLKNVSYLAILAITVFFVENILLFTNNSISETFGISSIVAGLYIYTMGYMGFSRSEAFSELVIIKKKEIEKEIIINEKYEKSGLSKEKADEYYKNLVSLMEKTEPFKQNKLTLSELAEMISISSHNLSEVINSKTGMNFFDFINRYRIEEVKRKIVLKDNENFTMLGIAMDAGFNSKSSFNTLFKKYEKRTPTQYRKETLLKKSYKINSKK